MVASDDRYRAIDPNHVEYFASGAVPMPPPHIQTIRPFVSGRRKSDGQRVCPTNQRHYAVAVFATDALRLHQMQCQPAATAPVLLDSMSWAQNICALRGGNKSEAFPRKQKRRNGARPLRRYDCVSVDSDAHYFIMRLWQLSPVLPAPKRACRDRADPRARRAHPGPAFEV